MSVKTDLPRVPATAPPANIDREERDQDDRTHSRLRLVFHKMTVLGLVSVWKCQRAHAQIYEVRVEDPGAPDQSQHHRIVRPLSILPFKHVLLSLDGNHSFAFEERSTNA